jgi:hypothetical protein
VTSGLITFTATVLADSNLVPLEDYHELGC